MSFFDYIIDELKAIFKDEGVLLFFVVLPLAYPLIYSWIYNNEVVRDVPVVLVDDSHSAMSREFTRKFDASPDVSVTLEAQSIAEAQDMIGHGEAYGILYFPKDFDTNTGRLEQSHVSIYCDMSYMLTYKAIMQSATAVSSEMGADLQKQLLGNHTKREDEIATKPLEFDEVPLFNVTGGYGNFILPAVLVLIIQQAMLLGVGMIAGTRNEERRRNPYPTSLRGWRSWGEAAVSLSGQSVAYLMVFSVMLAWITLIVPRIFGFVQLVHGWDLLLFFTPYLLSCVFFSVTTSSLVTYRESVMLVVVYTSLPLLFLSGISWPQSSIPGWWQGVAYMFPSTFGIRGFVRMSSMGALLGDVTPEYHMLWILTLIYGCIALIVTKLRTPQ
jgi:ABC-2 type transport system permease protein